MQCNMNNIHFTNFHFPSVRQENIIIGSITRIDLFLFFQYFMIPRVWKNRSPISICLLSVCLSRYFIRQLILETIVLIFVNFYFPSVSCTVIKCIVRLATFTFFRRLSVCLSIRPVSVWICVRQIISETAGSIVVKFIYIHNTHI